MVLGGPSGKIFGDRYPPAPGSPGFEELAKDTGISLIRWHRNPSSMMAPFYLDTEKSVEGVRLIKKWYAGSLVRDYHPDKWPTLDTVVALARRIGADVLLQVNSGTLWDEEQEKVRFFWDVPGADKLSPEPNGAMRESIEAMAGAAAGVVRYANIEKGYGVRYWEIGNEDYFLVHPQIYRLIVEEFTREMRAVDPSIVILATSLQEAYGPGVHQRLLPDGITYADWELAMSQFSPLVDFLSGHMYWGPGDPENTTLTPQLLADQVLSNAGWADGAVRGESDIAPTVVTEYNMAPYGKNRFSFTHAHALFMASALNAFVRDSVPLATYHSATTGHWALFWNVWDKSLTSGIQPAEDERIVWRMTPAAHAIRLFNRHCGSRLAKYGRVADSNYVVMYDEDSLYLIYVNVQPAPVRLALDCETTFSLQDTATLSVLSGKLFFEDEQRALCDEGEIYWSVRTIDTVLRDYPEHITENQMHVSPANAVEMDIPAWSIGYLACPLATAPRPSF
jgi:hypothetical protein